MDDDRTRVALVGALDTKSEEYVFVRDRLDQDDVGSVLVDVGVLGGARTDPDIDRVTVARAGGAELGELVRKADRNEAMQVMAKGAAVIVRDLVERGIVAGVMILGGSNAGFVMSRVADALPIGLPKLLVSTIVAGDTRPYVGTSDLTMMYPVVDIAGLNSVSRVILARAADACAGMVRRQDAPVPSESIEAVACSMFGVTTECVMSVHDRVVASGREVHTFHANGTGGRSMEAMVRSGFFSAVADITTTELADELFGGVCSAGPDRLSAAAESGVPQVVSVGALDMVNFGSPRTVPARYAGRLLHAHNPAVTLMRTSPDECRILGRVLAERLNRSTAFTEVHVPSRGFSQISVEGQPFHDPEADNAMIQSLQEHLDDRIPLRIHDAALNDSGFAHALTRALFRALASQKGTSQ